MAGSSGREYGITIGYGHNSYHGTYTCTIGTYVRTRVPYMVVGIATLEYTYQMVATMVGITWYSSTQYKSFLR